MSKTIQRLCVGIGACLLGFANIGLSGCGVIKLAGAMAQNYEYQKLIEVHPEYVGLENHTVAVLVDADYSILFEHPRLMEVVADHISARLAKEVEGIRVLNPQMVRTWQYQTPQWNAMPLSEVADDLGVNRLIHIDLYEFRLNPPGNQWLWEGVAAATIGLAERESYDADQYAETFNVVAEFPDVRGVTRDGASQNAVETGLLSRFVKESTWLFYTHTEPKYPDKYKPDMTTQGQSK
jgi:hypothetical protein